MYDGPRVTLLGVTKAHAARAVKWLRDRSILAFYDATERGISAFPTKHGSEWTHKALRDAYEATRR